MKKRLLVSALSMTLVLSVSMAFAAGSKIDGKVSNKALVNKSANIAIGKNNKANRRGHGPNGGKEHRQHEPYNKQYPEGHY